MRLALVAGLGTIGAFFVFGGFGLLGPGGGRATPPDDAMPKNAFLFATGDIAELRRSPLYAVLFSDRPETSVLDRKTLGIQRLADACGFDPLARVERMAVSVPEDGDKGDLGLAARVTITSADLEKCTTGLQSANPNGSPTEENGFAVVDAQGARVGYGHDLLVAGKGKWFDQMLATADGKNPSAKTAEMHTAVRSYLMAQNGWGAPTVLISARIPNALRDRIRREIGEGGGTGTEAMTGVLGVAGVGIALKTGAKGGSIDGEVAFLCDNDDACAGVEKLVERKRFDWSKELMLRMVGFGPLLDSISIKREGSKVLVTAGAPADTLAATLDRVMRFRGRRAPEVPGPAPVPGPKPDERIPAPRGR